MCMAHIKCDISVCYYINLLIRVNLSDMLNEKKNAKCRSMYNTCVERKKEYIYIYLLTSVQGYVRY